MRQTLHAVACQRGVGGNHSVHAVAAQCVGDDIDLGLIQIGGNLDEQRRCLAILFGQGFATPGQGCEQAVECLIALQRTQVLGVRARDIDCHVVSVLIDAVECDQVVVGGAFDGCDRVLADIESKQHRRLQRLALLVQSGALDVGNKGVKPVVVEAQAVDQGPLLRQAEHAWFRVTALR